VDEFTPEEWAEAEALYLSRIDWEWLVNILNRPPRDLPRLRAALDNDPFTD
jgi:uncharacterized protein (DUF1778 family)